MWLVILAAGVTTVFAVAISIDPYKDGKIHRQATHTQLGLQPCSFMTVTKLPCPSCGMTTSFALFVRADLWNSVLANFGGTLLAAMCLAFIPWALVSVYRGRPLFVYSMETIFLRVVIAFVTVMLLRWIVVVVWTLLE